MTPQDTAAELASAAPIFILGNGRSGTTLMRFMLNAHPDIHISEEICYHFWLRNFSGSFRRRLYCYFHSFSYAWLRMDPQVVLDKLPAELDWKDSALVYLRILQCKAAQYGKSRYGEKGPLLTERLDQLFREYPRARVIHMVRDPRAVVYSHFTMPWSTSSFLGANLMVHANMRAIARHGERILAIRLEDLLAQPETTLRKVLDFVGVEWSDNVLRHAEHLPENDGIPFPWLMEASRRPKQKSLNWQEAIPPAWIRLTETINRQALSTHGYAPHPLPHEPGVPAKICALIADLPQLFLTGWRYIRMVVRFILLSKTDARGFQTLLHSLNPAAWQRQPEWNSDLPAPPAVRSPERLLK
ncbi:conserved protein of unknown function [Sterolibacterium denitrificans]|uniref:Sulfotransferase n=1 Tax=Sterolibacterium denitrificans TaxID=157592 RepID=A0A7Z7HNC2_9PROT|nr:sulfotransferase [Sterolibacterium denitrificans]SMB21029.1 conserved protein of unknown function [Sterolibacterium denitrificans]